MEFEVEVKIHKPQTKAKLWLPSMFGDVFKTGETITITLPIKIKEIKFGVKK